MKKILSLANAFAFLLMVAINYLSNTGIFHGNTMETISDRYFNAFTPAGYAFSIWGLIYLGLAGFVVYTGRHLFGNKKTEPHLMKIGWWFVLSCLANSLWVVTWLYDHTGFSVLVMLFLLFCLLKIIVRTRMELDSHPFRKYLFIFWPFAVYTGWISIALIANVAAWLTKIGWNGWGLSEPAWTLIMICSAGLIQLAMITRRNLREAGAAGIWGLVAIAVSNSTHEGSTVVVYACYVVAAVILLFILINAAKTRQRSFEKM